MVQLKQGGSRSVRIALKIAMEASKATAAYQARSAVGGKSRDGAITMIAIAMTSATAIIM